MGGISIPIGDVPWGGDTAPNIAPHPPRFIPRPIGTYPTLPPLAMPTGGSIVGLERGAWGQRPTPHDGCPRRHLVGGRSPKGETARGHCRRARERASPWETARLGRGGREGAGPPLTGAPARGGGPARARARTVKVPTPLAGGRRRRPHPFPRWPQRGGGASKGEEFDVLIN